MSIPVLIVWYKERFYFLNDFRNLLLMDDLIINPRYTYEKIYRLEINFNNRKQKFTFIQICH